MVRIAIVEARSRKESHWVICSWEVSDMQSEHIKHYTIMDFLLSKYGLIFTEFDSIDRGGYYIVKRFMSIKCVPIYGLMFRILTRFHALYFGASCIHGNSIVWRRVNLARFPYWPEKRKWGISRYSYLMKTLISSEYGLTISGHVTVLRQWLSEKNTDYIINIYII